MASVVSVDDIEPEQSELTATTITKDQDDTEMVDNAHQESLDVAHQESSDVAHQESSDVAHQESSDAANKSPKTPSKKSNKSIPYTEVITNAIIALKDRTGSSQQAVCSAQFEPFESWHQRSSCVSKAHTSLRSE